MRAVVLEVDEAMLAERRRLGLDTKDEMWDGVLHMVPPAFSRHGEVQAGIVVALAGVVRRQGLRIATETGVFAADDDYRVPDIVVYGSTARSERGVEGAPELVVEIRSPGDESFEKLPWYLARGAKAVLVVERDSLAFQLHTAGGRIDPQPDGSVWIEALGVRLGPAGTTVAIDGVSLEL